MNKCKSAQGLSLNTMIIGIIVLIVLLVLVGSFGGFFGNRFNPGFSEATEQRCEGKGYKTLPECGELGKFNYEQVYARFAEGAVPEGEVCCKSSCEALEGAYCINRDAIDKDKQERKSIGDSGCPSGKICVIDKTT